MKKSQNKTQPTDTPVSKFVSKIVNDEQKKDTETLIRLMKKITKKKPIMWGPSIIGFDKYHYKYDSGREGDMPAIGFSPRKPNIVLYVAMGRPEIKKLLTNLGPYKTGKVCLYIKRLADIDFEVLEQIATESYKYVMSHKSDMKRAE